MSDANVAEDPDYTLPSGVSVVRVGHRAGTDMLGATGELVRVLIVEYPEDGRVFVMTEPPYTETPVDADKGRILRVFKRDEANPVPPDA